MSYKKVLTPCLLTPESLPPLKQSDGDWDGKKGVVSAGLRHSCKLSYIFKAVSNIRIYLYLFGPMQTIV